MPHMTFSNTEYERRLEQTREAMQEGGFDCLYLPYGPNQYYLTGLNAQPTSQAASRVLAALVPMHGNMIFVSPDRRRKLVEKASWVSQIRTWSFPDNPSETVAMTLRELGQDSAVIGFDASTPYQEVADLMKLMPQATFRSCGHLFANLRLRKSVEEIAQIRMAGSIADQAVEESMKVIESGASEADIAGNIFASLVRSGCDVFHVAVIAGKHAGFPEKSGNRYIERNQLILIFPKFSYNGYYSDITRMAIIGQLSDKERSIQEAIIRSHNSAVETAKPGVSYDEVDTAAREELERYDLAKYFTHGIGHGLGLETHEPPYIGTDTILEENMIFTIEPSVYRPEHPAMRIEDTFVVTADGCERLTQMELEVTEIPIS